MSADAAIRAAERSGDKLAHVRALLRAGRGQEALKVRGVVVGDEVVRAATSEKGRVGGPGPDARFVYVVFDEESPLRRATWQEGNEYRDQKPTDGRYGFFGTGWAVATDTLTLVALADDLPPLTLQRRCRAHYGGGYDAEADAYRDDLPCPQCGRSGKAPATWAEVNGVEVT